MELKNTAAIRRREIKDRIATRVVRLGGLGIVLAVLFIAAFLVSQAAPLAFPPEVADDGARYEVGTGLAVGMEPFAEAAWTYGEDGTLALVRLSDGATVDERQPLELAAGESVARARPSVQRDEVAVLTTEGRVGYFRLGFAVAYDEDLARSHSFAGVEGRWILDDPAAGVRSFDALVEEGAFYGARSFTDGTARVARGTVRVNRLTGEERVTLRETTLDAVADVQRVLFLEGGVVAAVDASDRLTAWQPDRAFAELQPLGEAALPAPVRAAQPLIGRGSLVLAHADGSITRWLFRLPEEGLRELVQGAPFEERVADPRAIAPSSRQRVFFVVGDGEYLMAQGTAGKTFVRGPLPPGAEHLLLTPREDHLAVFDADGGVELRPVDMAYPSVTAKTLFGKVQYEGLGEPSYTWQSTGGSDQYESKFSLVPLVVGTLKGTLWALLPSIPLGVLGALYCARFLRGRARETIKPFIELLAGIPSVVLGFLGALYLAPAIEDRLFALMATPLALAAVTMLLAWGWARLPLTTRRRFHEGMAAIALVPVYLVVGWLVLSHGPELEMLVFGAPLREWAPEVMGLTFEQKNSVVVGIAMGFAVMPLIFTLSEDAFRNIPRDLADASLALGATPWQTAVRVVAPPAMPGVIAACMLGLGRAIGETMIVLMATGGTPITNWNPLQGFRALSSNLATELPEVAKHGGLYRVLFLSALLLFAMTFVVNTVAEVIRVRGRKKL